MLDSVSLGLDQASPGLRGPDLDVVSTSDETANKASPSRLPQLSCSIAILCHRGSETFPALVSNVSLDGLRVESKERLLKGQRLLLELPGRASADMAWVPCIVQWCRRLPRKDGMLAGLRFDSATDLDSTSAHGHLAGTWLMAILDALGFIQSFQQEPSRTNGHSAPPCGVEPPLKEEAVTPSTIEAAEAETCEPPSEWARTPMEPEPTWAPPAPDDEWNALLADARAQAESLAKAPLLRRVLSTLRSFAVEDTASVFERRHMTRLSCDFKVTCARGRECFTAHVIDLHPGGLALRYRQPLNRGTLLRIEPPEEAPYYGTSACSGRVLYCRGVAKEYRLGVLLETNGPAGSWAPVALKRLGFNRSHLAEKRRYVRAQSDLAVEVRSWSGDLVRGVFVDLGRGGALLRSPKPWQPGEQVRFVVGPLARLPLLYLSGFVVHQRPEKGTENWLVSVRFAETDTARLKRLEQYLYALLRIE